MTNFHYFPLEEAPQAFGVVVVIDVLRAFTTAAYALDNGADRIIPVASVSEALCLREENNELLVMGEVDGIKPAAFDFSNSPEEIRQANLQNRVLVHRSSAGTQGLTRAKQAVELLAASFVVAGATANYLLTIRPKDISFVVTGTSRGRDGDEDRACAEYIEALVRGGNPDPIPFLERVKTSTVGRDFLYGKAAYLLQEDFALSSRVNAFPFFLSVHTESDLLIMEKGYCK